MLKLLCLDIVSCLLSHILKWNLLASVVSEEDLFVFKLQSRIWAIQLIQTEIDQALIKLLVVGDVVLPPVPKS